MSGFVFEQPESTERKRRPRAIVSCDYCRAKKSKCLPISGSARCHACTEAAVECTFQDRDRYQAERDRAYAAYLAQSSGSTAESNSQLGHFQAYMSSGTDACNYSTTTPLGMHGASMAFFSSTPSSSAPTTPPSAPSSRKSSPPRRQQQQPLFIGENSNVSPHPALMPHFIEAFFRQFEGAFPFLTTECVVSAFLRSTLNPVLANTIAAYAAPHCAALPQLQGIDVKDASCQYSHKAREQIDACPIEASIGMIEALVLMSYIERGLGRQEVFHAYVQRAAHAGMSVGLSADATITAMSYTEGERQCLHALWAAIMQLYQELSGQQYSTQILAII